MAQGHDVTVTLCLYFSLPTVEQRQPCQGNPVSIGALVSHSPSRQRQSMGRGPDRRPIITPRSVPTETRSDLASWNACDERAKSSVKGPDCGSLTTELRSKPRSSTARQTSKY